MAVYVVFFDGEMVGYTNTKEAAADWIRENMEESFEDQPEVLEDLKRDLAEYDREERDLYLGDGIYYVYEATKID
jgi:hypothetical protein